MKKNFLLLCITLITFTTSIFFPSKAVALSGDNTYKIKQITSDMTFDEKMICSKYNCDPKILIPGNTDIDPEFLVTPETNKSNGK